MANQTTEVEKAGRSAQTGEPTSRESHVRAHCSRSHSSRSGNSRNRASATSRRRQDDHPTDARQAMTPAVHLQLDGLAACNQRLRAHSRELDEANERMCARMEAVAKKTLQPDRCERIRLSASTKRRLWSECGGYCQNPECAEFLFVDDDVDFAEMAHIVAASSGGSRDVSKSELTEAQRAHHTNVAVLCSRCHTVVDKSPGRYPIEKLKDWKRRHQAKLETALGTPSYATRLEARVHVRRLLDQNATIFRAYGPVSETSDEDRAELWRHHAVKVIIPNNAEIVRVLRGNRNLLSTEEEVTADRFELHASELAARHIPG